MYSIHFAEGAIDDLAELRAFDRKRVMDAVESQLGLQPLTQTRNRKPLVPGDVPPWEHEPPVWELRVGELRAFYDVDEDIGRVVVRAVRRKSRQTTKEIL